MKIPKVLVVIPLYNGAATLAKAVDSVLQQTFQDFQLVIVDDRSTDDSWSVAKQLVKKNKKITLLKHSKNYGVCRTRNDGAKQFNSKYLSFLDQNDLYEPDFLEKTVEVLDKYPVYDAVKVGFKVNLSMHPLQYLAIYESIPNNLLVRRQAFEFIGGFSEDEVFKREYAGEDIALNRLLEKFFNVLKVKEQLYNYLAHPGCHMYKFLERTKVENGQLKFLHTNENDTAVIKKIQELEGVLKQKVRILIQESQTKLKPKNKKRK